MTLLVDSGSSTIGVALADLGVDGASFSFFEEEKSGMVRVLKPRDRVAVLLSGRRQKSGASNLNASSRAPPASDTTHNARYPSDLQVSKGHCGWRFGVWRLYCFSSLCPHGNISPYGDWRAIDGTVDNGKRWPPHAIGGQRTPPCVQRLLDGTGMLWRFKSSSSCRSRANPAAQPPRSPSTWDFNSAIVFCISRMRWLTSSYVGRRDGALAAWGVIGTSACSSMR